MSRGPARCTEQHEFNLRFPAHDWHYIVQACEEAREEYGFTPSINQLIGMTLQRYVVEPLRQKDRARRRRKKK